MLIDTDDMIPATTFNRAPGKYIDLGAEGGRPIIVKDNVPVAFVGSLDDLRRLQALDNVDPATYAFKGPEQMPTGRWVIGQDPGGGRVWIQVANHVLAVGEGREVLDLAVSAALGTWLQGADAPSELLIGTSGFVSPVIWHGHQTPPKIRGVVVDLDEKANAARFATQIRAQFEARKQLLIQHGFPSLSPYRPLIGEEAVPDLIVAVQLADAPHTDLAAILKHVVRRGPELGMYLWLFSETVPEWVTPQSFPQRIAFTVRSALTSRELVGTMAASVLAPHSTDGYLQTPELEGACRFSLQPADLEQEAGYHLDKLGAAGRSAMDEPLALAKVIADHTPEDAGPDTPISWPVGYSDDSLIGTSHLKYFSTVQGSQILVGRPGSGVSTALQTIILSAASLYSPSQVGFYAINCGGRPLGEIENLPHIGAIGHNTHEDTRIVETVRELVQARRARASNPTAPDWHKDSQQDHIAPDYRQTLAETATIDDGYPKAVYLVVDGYGKFLAANTSLMYPRNPLNKDVIEIARLGAQVGVYVLVGTEKTVEVGQDLLQACTPWELKPSPGDVSAIRLRSQLVPVSPSKLIPEDQPGRAVDHLGHQIRFAICGTDQETRATTVEDTVRDIAERVADYRPVPTPKLLPTQVDSGTLATWEPSGERYAIGIAERDLQPAIVDFSTAPLMMVYGDADSGRGEFVAHMLDAIVHQHPSGTDAEIIVVDLQGRLRNAVERTVVPRGAAADMYVTDVSTLSERLAVLRGLFHERRSPADASPQQCREWAFEGPNVYLVIEDLAQLPKNLSNQGLLFEPLRQYIATAQNVGLRIIAASSVKNVTGTESMPGLPLWMITAGMNTVMLRSRAASDQSRGWRFERDMPHGRALLVNPSGDAQRVQLAGQRPVTIPEA